jgi:hypothetical protein
VDVEKRPARDKAAAGQRVNEIHLVVEYMFI